MLKTKLLHPEILMELGRNGHGAKILISDGNFPVTTCTPPTAKKVFLNFTPGVLNVVDVLTVLRDFIPIESATVMQPADGSFPPIHEEFKNLIGANLEFNVLKRFEFYDVAKSPDVCLAIATAESRRFANIILTIGVIKPEE
jgi:L-fucose mutarotase